MQKARADLQRLKELRAAVGDGVPDPSPALEAYLHKVSHEAFKVYDAEVEALLASGYSQEQLYEATMIAALTAGIERFEAGLAALEEVN